MVLRTPVVLFMLLVVAACAPLSQGRLPQNVEPRLGPDFVVAPDGTRLGLASWIPKSTMPDYVMVMFHGFAQYAGGMAVPAADLAKQNVAVYAMDLRGHGDAPRRGVFAEAGVLGEDGAAFINAVRQRHPDIPLFVLGYSMGVAVALDSLSRPETARPDGLVLVSPGLRSWRTLDSLDKTGLFLMAHTVPWFKPGMFGRLSPKITDNEEYRADARKDEKFLRGWRVDLLYQVVRYMDQAWEQRAQIEMQPTLVLYGGNDEVIACNLVAEFTKGFEDSPHLSSRFHPDGHHMVIWDNARSAYLGEMLEWMKEPGSDLGNQITPAVCPPKN